MNMLSQQRSWDFAVFCMGCETLLVSGNSAELTGFLCYTSFAFVCDQRTYIVVCAPPIMPIPSLISGFRDTVILNVTLSQSSKRTSGPTRRVSVVRS